MLRTSRRYLAILYAMLAMALAVLAAPRPAAAHPLGNFSVNRYSRIEVDAAGLRLRYALDMAEIPTLQELAALDADADGTVSAGERAAHAQALAARLAAGLSLRADGKPLPLSAGRAELTLRPGQAGLETLYLRLDLTAPLPEGAGPWRIDYADTVFGGRAGWGEVVVRGPGLLEASAPAEDLSRELTAYPPDMLAAPMTSDGASFRFAAVAGQPAASAERGAAPPAQQPGDDQLAALVNTPITGPLALAGVLLTAMALGAAHALTPGHGKTIVAAYLVGARGTAAHALFLGLTTTITHTAGVFGLGLVTLFVSAWVLPEQLYPWLGVLSGALIFSIGAALLRQRYAALRGAGRRGEQHEHHELDEHGGHDHGAGYHTHAPPPVSWRGLLALGVSGGLLPCPSALVLLLGAVALGRPALGLLLVLGFSLGLAGVLTGLGLLLVRARGLFARLPAGGVLLPGVSLAGAALVTVAGVAITLRALVDTGLLS
jgi:nickel/cobalt exporter